MHCIVDWYYFSAHIMYVDLHGLCLREMDYHFRAQNMYVHLSGVHSSEMEYFFRAQMT